MNTRAFVDANILFSACYRENSGLLRLWEFPQVQICASPFVVLEAERNLAEQSQRDRLRDLLTKTTLVDDSPTQDDQRETHGLPAKDQPVLWTSIDSKADFLVTGDMQHFGPLMNKVIEGVEIIRAAELLRRISKVG